MAAVEEKAEVEMLALSESEIATLALGFGFEVKESQRLYGGYASSNVRVVLTRPGSSATQTLMLKVSHVRVTFEDLLHQIVVLNHLKPHGFPTNYPHSVAGNDTSFIFEAGEQRALLLDFFDNVTPGQKILASHEGQPERIAHIMRELGATLAKLHLAPWPVDVPLRDVRTHGYALCNTGDLLKGTAMDELDEHPAVKGHEFLATCRKLLPWLRSLYAKEFAEGLIHGDAFLDNTLYDADGCLKALVDWEDSAKGPYVLDLAVCLSAACFSATNELSLPRLSALLAGYVDKRPLSAAEADCLTDFMAAGSLACAFYRFGEFQVRQPDSDQRAKDSFRIHAERASLLLDEDHVARQQILAAAREVCV